MSSLREISNACCASAAALLFLLPQIAQAQSPSQQSPPNQQSNDYALLTYDVRDLVLEVPDYPYPLGGGLADPRMDGFGAGGGGFGGGGGIVGRQSTGGRSATQRTSGADRLTMDALQHAIQEVVAPATWELEGGEGRVRQLGTTLVVWQVATRARSNRQPA